MQRKMNVFRSVLVLLALIGFGVCTPISWADTTLYGADVRGLYVGQSSAYWSVFIRINDQTPYFDTANGTHAPWSYISGTISVNYGPEVFFTGTVRWGGRMDLDWYEWYSYGYVHGGYTAWIMDTGRTYETTNGTFEIDALINYGQWGWIDTQLESGWFYGFRWWSPAN